MKNAITFTVAVAVAGIAPVTYCHAEERMKSPVTVTLRMEATSAEVIAHVKFTNSGKHRFAIEPRVLCRDGQPNGSLFRITDAAGQEVRYRGIMVKRPPTAAKDMIQLEPDTHTESAVRLDLAYDLRPGVQYTVQFQAYNGGEGNEDTTLTSEKVVFRRGPPEKKPIK